jgi:nucleoside-diphosphate-sugar epimerase
VENEDFILGPVKHLTQIELVDIISNELGIKSPTIFLPEYVAYFASYIIKSISKIFGVQPILYPDRVRVLTSDFYFNTEKLKRYGFKTKYTFKEGLADTIKNA